MKAVSQQPVIKQALGAEWDQLSDIVKRHYDITPGIPSEIEMQGVMHEIYHSNIAKLFLLPGRLFGALVSRRGKKVPAVVRNWTTVDSKAMFWRRTFDFLGAKPLVFASRMEHIKGDEIIEYVRFGMGIRIKMSVVNSALIFTSIGYQWDIGPISISIPTWMILGSAVIRERAVSGDKFYMDFEMNHPIFGRTFAYSGTFTLVSSDT